MTSTIAVALSGGIDSLVSAFLLKKMGHSVIGIHFETGFETEKLAPSSQGNRLVRELTDQLGIPVHIVDCRTSFKTHVLDYFTKTYLAGQTPNPCMICNATIKFGVMLNEALSLGANMLATGHYARVSRDTAGTYRLYKGKDSQKEQSYFLSLLNQYQLSYACFPLADLTKTEVKAFAEQNGLHPVTQKESQDICFISDGRYQDFLVHHAGYKPQPGFIVDRNRNRIGRHRGLHRFTVGQRKGINCPGPAPYYVLAIDSDRNELVVGFKAELSASRCKVRHINWILPDIANEMNLQTRIRYRHKAAASTVVKIDANTARVLFDVPQDAITPGQGAVFYHGDEVVGGGWITL